MLKRGFTHESRLTGSEEWYTPPAVFDALGLRFAWDVCSPGAEAVPWIPADRHLTVFDDALTVDWNDAPGPIWMNPPYNRDRMGQWMRRFAGVREGVALVFARTDTEWWHSWAMRCDALLFVRKRIAFVSVDGAMTQTASAASALLARGTVCEAALMRCGLGIFVWLRGNVGLSSDRGA